PGPQYSARTEHYGTVAATAIAVSVSMVRGRAAAIALVARGQRGIRRFSRSRIAGARQLQSVARGTASARRRTGTARGESVLRCHYGLHVSPEPRYHTARPTFAAASAIPQYE